ncbi:MAG: TIGR00730 family Rossman fold protein [Dysgonomonas sp.]
MKNICVFCGSNSGNDQIYMTAAYNLGKKLAENNINLIYGGAKVGLMGAVANGTLDNGGKVMGVLPNFLKEKELAHEGLSEIIIVETMHQRKSKMYELSDGIIVLPGGFGTMDEMFEFLTWGQLSLHKKPTGLLNIDGYYDNLLAFIDTSIDKGFVKEEYRNMIIVDDSIDTLIEGMKNYVPSNNEKWFVTK